MSSKPFSTKKNARTERGSCDRRRGLLRVRRALLVETLESRRLLAFGVTQTTGGAASYVIDNGGNLKFSVLRNGATTSSTIHLGDITSIKYKNQEMLATYAVTSRYSHYEQGLGSGSTISYVVDNTNGWIMVKSDDSAATSGAVIQYYLVRRNDNNIYMASLPIDVNNGPGEGRFIAYLDRNVFTNPEEPSDLAGNTGAIEGSDVFGFADGTTASKFYNMGRQMIENEVHGLTGTAGATTVGAWMFMGDREHSAGGAFFKDIDFQAGSAVEIYNCIFTGHTQTEAYRQGLHTYAFQFTDGTPPVEPDYSWLENVKDAGGNLLISGLVLAAQRGAISGKATGNPAGEETVVALSNPDAQYWDMADASGNYSITGVLPGTYTETLYSNELAVGTRTVTITAGATTRADITSTYFRPIPTWRIGTWDGTPVGFLNSDKIEIMHPSDSRMSSWTTTPNFVVGADNDAEWPMVQFMGINNSQRITFNLTSTQAAAAQTLRIGITLGFEGGRNRVTVNAGQAYAWTSSIPPASRDLNSRGITRGTWRGDNQLYTYNIPTSALRAGTNTIDLPVVSGSYVAGQTWLSPNVVYDAIDLVPTSSLTDAPRVTTIAITPANPNVAAAQSKQFTATARDQFGNVTPANFVWSTTNGTIDDTGLYVAPATTGSGSVTATSGTVSGNTNVNIVASQPPTVATPAAASPNPASSTSVNLSVAGADDGGEAALTYTWSLTGTPPAAVAFTANGTNAAKNTTATFTVAGTYNFLVTITDSAGLSTTSGVSVPVSFGAFTDSADVGAPALAGSLDFNAASGVYTITGGGADIWNTSDQFRFSHQTVSGDINIVARVTSQTNTSASAKAGVMIRDGAAANAMHAMVVQTPGTTGVAFQYRSVTGGTTTNVNVSGVTVGSWVRLTRIGNQFSAAYSTNGTTWVPIGSPVTINMPTVARAGLAVTSHNTSATSTATFTNFTIAPPAGGVGGRAFHDVNADGVFAAGEPAMGGVTVFLDANGNSILDPGERQTTSAGDGTYAFANVPLGAYTVRTIEPSDFASAGDPPVVVTNGGTATADIPHARIVYSGSGGADQYLVRKNAGGKYEVLIGGALAYTNFAATPSLTFNFLGGNDTLTLDFANAAPVPSGGITVDGGAGEDDVAVVMTAAAETITFNASDVAFGGLTGTLEHTNMESASFDGNGGWDSVTVNGGPALTFADAQQLQSLTLTGSSAAQFALGATATVARSLTVGDSARLDLADTTMIVESDDPNAFADTAARIAAGYNIGAWDAAGIVTSRPAALAGLTTIGISTGEQVLGLGANDTDVFAGQTISGRSVILKYTYAGDVNLDGVIDGGDYGAVDNFAQVPGASGYFNGDLNYDGVIDGGDYGIIDNNIQAQGPPL